MTYSFAAGSSFRWRASAFGLLFFTRARVEWGYLWERDDLFGRLYEFLVAGVLRHAWALRTVDHGARASTVELPTVEGHVRPFSV